MEKILVTGGAGFIGSNLVKKLSENFKIFVVDDLSMGKLENIKSVPNVEFYKESVLNKKFMTELLTKENFEYVFHLAAIASVADSIVRPKETHEVNLEATLQILEILKQMGNRKLKRLVFASSAAVYGDDPELPKTESSKVKPLTPYAIDKYSAEKFVLMYNDFYGVPTSVVRFFNVFGPNQNPDSEYSGVISIIVDRFLKQINNQQSDFNIFGDGEQSRDFIYISDVLQALEIVAFSTDSLGNVYNVGRGEATSINTLLKLMSNIFDKQITIKLSPERSGDIKQSVANIDELQKLGFRSKYSVERGLKEYLKSFSMHNKIN